MQIRTVGYNSLPITDNCMQAKLHAADRLVAVIVLRRTGGSLNTGSISRRRAVGSEVAGVRASPWIDGGVGRHGTYVETHSWSNPEESSCASIAVIHFCTLLPPLASPREINGRLRS